MSDSHNSAEPSESQVLFHTAGVLATIFVFALILYFAYLPNRPGAVDESLIEQRREAFGEIRAKQHELATTYGWVDRTQGVVRIPVSRAMELTVRELAARQRSRSELEPELQTDYMAWAEED